MSKTVLGWHFTGPVLRDGCPIPPVGEWLVYGGDVKICKSGLHASQHPVDALQYAPGALLHLVECADIVDEHEDKFVCRRRRIIASMDVTEMLRYYARMQALSVIHLWDASDVVLDYLMTGNIALRAAARADARAAARAGARDAAWAAAWSAAREAAWEAAREAARDDFNSLVRECFEGPLKEKRDE